MTEKRPAGKKRDVEINTALQRVLEHNPGIEEISIELFSEIYYPVAVLEIDMTETTFEDFELVPLTVLRFVAAGIVTAEDIAEMTGLTAGYVGKVLDLLMGYGYLDTGGLTPLGAESLRMEKQIARTSVKQRFQADAVTGDLLKLGEQTQEENLRGKESTYHVIPHLRHIEGVSVAEINRQLASGDLTEYHRYRGDILNANLDEIRNITCMELVYVRAYLMKLKGLASPVIIMYRYDPGKKAFKERFRWLPVRVPEEAAYEKYQFDRSIPLYTPEAQEIINDLYRLVCRQIEEEQSEKQREELLSKIHPFRYETMDVRQETGSGNEPGQILVYLNADSFTGWDAFVLKFLAQFDMVKGYLYTDSRLNGRFIRFETQNNEIKRAAKTYQRALRQTDSRQLNTYIRNRLFGRKEGTAFRVGALEETITEYRAESKE